MESELKYSYLTEQVIASFFRVYNSMGYGFLEKVYENAMFVDLQKYGLKVEKQKAIDVFYEGVIVGEYFADLIVENKIIVELKASEKIAREHLYQLVNYLKATDKEVGLLLNFGKKAEFKRKIYSNERKNLI